MLTMDKIKYITSIRQFEGLTLREISRKTGYHFNTVKKYVDAEDWNRELKEKNPRASKLDPLKPVIDEWLKNDQSAPRKQRHTNVRVYNRLQKEYPDTLHVKQSTVTRYAQAKKQKLYRDLSDCAIFGTHPFGEAQLDFGEVYHYDKDDALKKVYELALSLPASNGAYVQLCRTQNQECLLEAMQRIFDHMGGVPTRILFDNMSSAVAQILPAKERILIDQFSRFTLHYRYQAAFCNVAKGNEKGHVEGKIGYQRRNYMVPVPKITDFDEYNKALLHICDEDMNRQHYTKQSSIRELYYQDQQHFLQLPEKRFTVGRIFKAKTDLNSFVSFENNRYSTAPLFTQREVWVEATADRIRILDEKYMKIASHERCNEKRTSPVIDWLAYLPAIVRKPQALRYTEFFKTLPSIWQDYFNQGDYEKNKQMIAVLSPLICSGNLKEATIAIEMALACGTDDAESFLACYRKLTEPKVSLVDIFTPSMPKQIGYIQNWAPYEELMKGPGEQVNC